MQIMLGYVVLYQAVNMIFFFLCCIFGNLNTDFNGHQLAFVASLAGPF